MDTRKLVCGLLRNSSKCCVRCQFPPTCNQSAALAPRSKLGRQVLSAAKLFMGCNSRFCCRFHMSLHLCWCWLARRDICPRSQPQSPPPSALVLDPFKIIKNLNWSPIQIKTIHSDRQQVENQRCAAILSLSGRKKRKQDKNTSNYSPHCRNYTHLMFSGAGGKPLMYSYWLALTIYRSLDGQEP